jgi:hypothetical protein
MKEIIPYHVVSSRVKRYLQQQLPLLMTHKSYSADFNHH